MERQPKRRKLHREDPDTDLHEQRARNDLHLKSRFEAIFEKYGQDFSAVADEIDLETGKIVVDKGHIQRMAHEQDVGQDANPSSQQRSDYLTAPEYQDDAAYHRSSNRLPRVSVENTTGSAAGSDLEMTDAVTKRAVVIMGQTTIPSTPPLSRLYALEQSERSGRRYTRPSLHDKTPLHRLEVDQISNRLSVERKDMYYPPIEPAWQVPPLPIDRLAQIQRPILNSRMDEQRKQQRSLSPPGGSLWAPVSGKGRHKNSRTPSQARKPTFKTRRSSMPAYKTNRPGETPRKDARQRTSITRSPPKRDFSDQACRKLWTCEEEKLLRHLRANTDLTYAQMTSYFPGRSWIGIECRWLQIADSNKTPLRTSIEKPTTIGFRSQTKMDKNFVRMSLDSVAQDDEEVDELQAYDFGFQATKPVVRQDDPRTPSLTDDLSRSASVTWSSPVLSVPPDSHTQRSTEDLSRSTTEALSVPMASLPSEAQQQSSKERLSRCKSTKLSPPLTRQPSEQSERRSVEHSESVDAVATRHSSPNTSPLIFHTNPEIHIQSRRKSTPPKNPTAILQLVPAVSDSTPASAQNARKSGPRRRATSYEKPAMPVVSASTPATSRGKEPGLLRRPTAHTTPAVPAVPSFTPVPSRNAKTHTQLCISTSSEALIGPLDDLSEDELATPIPLPKRLLVPEPTPGSSKPLGIRAIKTPVSKINSTEPIIYQIDDVSDDELSKPFDHGALALRCRIKVSASKRRKTSIW